jgi:hypothetical protein
MPDVFISYSADAKKLAERLAGSLQKEVVATWSDFENVGPGVRLYDQLQLALDHAKFYLIVVGPRNVVPDWQDQEWQGALERTWSDPDKRIIPILVGHAEAPAFLRSWAPFRIEPGRSESASIRKLVEVIKKYPPAEQAPREDARLGRDWQKRIRNIESAASN